MGIKHFIGITSIVTLSLASFNTQQAQAVCRVFNIDCHVIDEKPEPDSTFYNFQLKNATNSSIKFLINDIPRTLQSGESRIFRYPRTYSYNSSKKTYHKVIIKWNSGSQDNTITLPFNGYLPWHKFVSTKDGIGLFSSSQRFSPSDSQESQRLGGNY